MHAVKASIAINNIGVSLLEKGQFDAAKASFRDAISIMANTFDNTDAFPQPFQPLSLEDIEQKLLNANHRAAMAVTETKNLVGISMEVLSDDSSTSFFDREALWSGLSANRLFAVRIDPCDGCSSRDSCVDTSIILSNYGVAHKCMARLNRSHDDNYHRYVDGSLQLWRLAYSGLARRSEEDHSSRGPRLLEMCSVALYNLIGALIEQEMDCEAKKHASTLDQILSYLTNYNTFMGECMLSVAAAA